MEKCCIIADRSQSYSFKLCNTTSHFIITNHNPTSPSYICSGDLKQQKEMIQQLTWIQMKRKHRLICMLAHFCMLICSKSLTMFSPCLCLGSLFLLCKQFCIYYTVRTYVCVCVCFSRCFRPEGQCIIFTTKE